MEGGCLAVDPSPGSPSLSIRKAGHGRRRGRIRRGEEPSPLFLLPVSCCTGGAEPCDSVEILMARSLSQAPRMAAAFSEHAGVFLTRRAYSASAASKSIAEKAAQWRAPEEEEKEKTTGTGGEPSPPPPPASWGPDPVTGDYRPGSRAAEMDVAELRRRVLPH